MFYGRVAKRGFKDITPSSSMEQQFYSVDFRRIISRIKTRIGLSDKFGCS
jgi:hypothetical protein